MPTPREASDFNNLGRYTTFLALSDQHGESVTYNQSESSPLAITAVVLRAALQTRGTDGGRRLEYEHELLVNQADVPTITVNGDTVSFAKRPDAADSITKTVSRIINQDGGVWHLGLA